VQPKVKSYKSTNYLLTKSSGILFLSFFIVISNDTIQLRINNTAAYFTNIHLLFSSFLTIYLDNAYFKKTKKILYLFLPLMTLSTVKIVHAKSVASYWGA